MKKIIISVCLAAATLLAGKQEAQSQCVNPQVWHYQFTQTQRNSYIVMAAQSRVNTYAGDCKVWVQNLIPWICGVQIPQNAPIPIPWYWVMPAPYIVGSYGYQCPRVVPGCIIQMQVPNRYTGILGPHTAIVASVTSTGFNFIDCNWLGDGIVRPHFVSYTDFNRWTQFYYYSVYTIQ